ncbi:MAG TPA: hypothetical protein VGH80_13270 [Xanthomonadaceae bacterium]|jgi:hypothetical protein
MITRRSSTGLAVLAILGCLGGFARAAGDTATPLVPAGTEVAVQTLDTMSSATAKLGDRFAVRVATDVRVGDRIVIPAGSPGKGTVIFARTHGPSGRAGALDLRIDEIDLPSGAIRLESFGSHRGIDRRNGARAAMAVAGLIGLLAVQGTEITLPAGTQLAGVVVATPADGSSSGPGDADGSSPGNATARIASPVAGSDTLASTGAVDQSSQGSAATKVSGGGVQPSPGSVPGAPAGMPVKDSAGDRTAAVAMAASAASPTSSDAAPSSTADPSDTPINPGYRDEPSWMPKLEPGQGMAIVYRLHQFGGSMWNMNLYCDDRQIEPLHDGKFVYISMTPGDHLVYSDKRHKDDARIVRVEPGEVRFFEATPTSNTMSMTLDLLEIDELVAKQKIAEMLKR